jgi:hypothetical protein
MPIFAKKCVRTDLATTRARREGEGYMNIQRTVDESPSPLSAILSAVALAKEEV